MRRFARSYCIHFVAAEPEMILNKLSTGDIEILDAVWIDPLTVEFSVRYSQCALTLELLNLYGVQYSINKKQGILWQVLEIRKRWVLIVGMVVLLHQAAWLQ